MKKIFINSLILIVTAVILFPFNIYAATSANIYVTPSASNVVKGNNVTVSVRVNPNSNPVDSVQATINFDSGKLQYLSYSGGSFTTFQANASGSSFSYVGTLLGSSVSSDSLLFSITFKAIADGTSPLSLSGLSSAYQGSAFGQTTAVNGSVTISTPVAPPPPAPKPPIVNRNNNVPPEPVVESDKTPPKLIEEPSIIVDKTSIRISFKTDENSKVYLKYTFADSVKSLKNTELKTEHTFLIGDNSSLFPGSIYKFEFEAEDGLGNRALIFNKEIRTTGVDYKVKITDLYGVPLSNHKVQLFSDPKETITDKEGIATFSDVTPGDHTLVFEIDGLVLKKPVKVGQDIRLTNQDQETTDTVLLPVTFQKEILVTPNYTQNYIIVGIVTGIVTLIIVSTLFILKEKGVFSKLRNKIRNKRESKT